MSSVLKKIKQYDEALKNIETGILLLYDNIPWGTDDEGYVKVLISAYKLASDISKETGDEFMYEQYNEKYQNMLWMRGYSDEAITDWMAKMNL